MGCFGGDGLIGRLIIRMNSACLPAGLSSRSAHWVCTLRVFARIGSLLLIYAQTARLVTGTSAIAGANFFGNTVALRLGSAELLFRNVKLVE
jgi:hypothetical protein